MYGLTDSDIFALATDDPIPDEVSNTVIDSALSEMSMANRLPYILEEPTVLMAIFRAWSINPAAFTEACSLAGVRDSIISEVHDRCCAIFDRIEEVRHPE